MKSKKVNVRGSEWKFILLSDNKYDTLFNEDSSKEGSLADAPKLSAAQTVLDEKKVYVRDSDCNGLVIRHELGHCYVAASHIGSAELTAAQMEEVCCDIIAENLEEILKHSNTILKHFKK